MCIRDRFLGIEASYSEIIREMENVYLISRVINAVNGFDEKDDVLPEKAYRRGMTKELFSKIKAGVYERFGLDERGIPKTETLEKRGLTEAKNIVSSL